MPSPFPGMDPYLEDPRIWSGVHAAILAGISEQLGPALRPKYAVRYDERVYVTSPEDPAYRLIVPDVRIIERDKTQRIAPSGGGLAIAEPITIELADDEIHERSLQILDLRDCSVVTVIEVLSPTNKGAGSFGRASFLQKRREVIAAGSHWMEIDLLRGGVRTAHLPGVASTEYQVYLSRADARRQARIWPMSLREPLPVIGVPLRGDDADAPLNLQAVLDALIARGSYDLDTDYTRDPVPPLPAETALWSRERINSSKMV